ncbi:MAG: CoA pyrophosphatase [Pseudomonadota bacterium]
MMKISLSCLKHNLERAMLPQAPEDEGYKSACVFLLLFDLDRNPQIMAIQKADNEGYPWRNQVALPGGHLEDRDENPLKAAYRELEEEVNIPHDHVELIGSMGHFQTIFHRDVEVFIGLWNGKSDIRFDASEISKMVAIPIENLIKTHQEGAFSERQPDVFELLYPYDDVTVWGLTAKIFHFFIETTLPCFATEGFSSK